MKKKMNYLHVLLTAIFMVGCTSVEDASITKVETVPQEVPAVDTDADEAITAETNKATSAVVDEPVVEETYTQPDNELFEGYELIEVVGGFV